MDRLEIGTTQKDCYHHLLASVYGIYTDDIHHG